MLMKYHSFAFPNKLLKIHKISVLFLTSVNSNHDGSTFLKDMESSFKSTQKKRF